MYKKIKLTNGMCLVYEKVLSQAVSVGLWVKAGSMYEKAEENGISHFTEHMLFKGTKRRSAFELADETDYVGGQINAYTSRECTCYYIKTLSESMELSIDILSDMYYNSLFREEDIESEKKVVIEEINMYEDSPEDVSLDALCEKVWSGNPLGAQILGTEKSVLSFTRENITDYVKRRYTPENTVISVCGGFDEKKLISLCENYFSGGSRGKDASLKEPVWKSGRWIKKKDIEQTHLSIGYPAYSLSDDRIYPLAVMNNVLGGSVSGRLFRSLREKYALCYSIYSYTSLFPDAGMLGIYAGLNFSELKTAEKLIDEEIEKLITVPVSDYELEKAHNQLKCGIIMNGESISSKMAENGKMQLLKGVIHTDEETISKIESVNAKDIMHIASDIFRSDKKAVFILEKA